VREEASYFNHRRSCDKKQRRPGRIGVRSDKDLSRLEREIDRRVEDDAGKADVATRRCALAHQSITGRY
jgi:hypothetical protein